MTDGPHPEEERPFRFRRAAPICFCIVAAAIRLWLSGQLRLTVMPPASYDGDCYRRMAASIMAGDWLGPYSVMTLVRPPGFPLFLAATAKAGVNIFLAQDIVYLSSCALCAWAAWRMSASRIAATGVFVLLAFNPGPFDVQSRELLRDHLYMSLTLAFAACLVAAGATEPGRRTVYAWLSGAGLAFGYAWIVREEGVVLLPVLVLGWSVVLFRDAKSRPSGRRLRTPLLVIPLVLCFVPKLAVEAKNRSRYGSAWVSELRSDHFLRALGALMRVAPQYQVPDGLEARRERFYRSFREAHPLIRVPKADWEYYCARPQRFYPVLSETLERMYPRSPTLRKMRPHLEGDIAERWSLFAPVLLGEPEDANSVNGSVFLLYLRECADRVGAYRDPETTVRFYSGLAEEINAACEAGELPSRSGERASLLPPFDADAARFFPGRFCTLAWRSVSFRGVLPATRPSMIEPGDPALDEYRRITHAPPAPPETAADELTELDATLRAKILKALSSFYRVVGVLVAVAGIAGIARVLQAKTSNRLIIPACVLIPLVGALSRIGMLAWLDVFLCPVAYQMRYFIPVHPLLLTAGAFGMLGFLAAASSTPDHSGEKRFEEDEDTPAPEDA